MSIQYILGHIRKDIGKVETDGFVITITPDHKKLNPRNIGLLYDLLNHFQDLYFIVLKGMPCCLMPDASEHILPPPKNLKGPACCVAGGCLLSGECPGWSGSLKFDKKLRIPQGHLPGEIVFEITSRCNLHCSPCNREKPSGPDIPFGTLKKKIDECKKAGIKTVRFTGGEPLLHKDIAKMLLYAKTQGLSVLLNTNAVSIPDPLWGVLSKAVVVALVSLQGYDQRSDNLLAGSGEAFRRKIANTIRLKAAIPIVRAGTVISKTLIRDFYGYHRLLKRLNIDDWDLYRPLAKNAKPEFQITRKDIKGIMGMLLGLKKTNFKARIANPVPFCVSEDRFLSFSTLSGGLADDGATRLVWDARGYFKPSYFIDRDLGRSLADACRNDFLIRLRSLAYLPVRCKKCPCLKWCRGGSRAAAEIARGDLFGLDPFMRGGA